MTASSAPGARRSQFGGVDIVDNAYHGLIRNEISRHAVMGAPAAATAGGMVDGEQPLELAAQAQPVASLDGRGIHRFSERSRRRGAWRVSDNCLLAIALGEMAPPPRGAPSDAAAGQFPRILRRADARCHAAARVGVDEPILDR